jgi:hypothetical protein
VYQAGEKSQCCFASRRAPSKGLVGDQRETGSGRSTSDCSGKGDYRRRSSAVSSAARPSKQKGVMGAAPVRRSTWAMLWRSAGAG